MPVGMRVDVDVAVEGVVDDAKDDVVVEGVVEVEDVVDDDDANDEDVVDVGGCVERLSMKPAKGSWTKGRTDGRASVAAPHHCAGWTR